jgi:hypothetical protein
LALLASLLMWPSSARALDASAARMSQEAMAQTLEFSHNAITNGSDEKVYGSGQAIEARMTGASFVFSPSLHQVQRAQVTGDQSTVADMLAESARLLGAAKTTPPDGLETNLARQQAMNGQNRVGFDGALADQEMGVFRFLKGKVDQGTIALNTQLAEIGRLVGHAFAAATLFHEAGHAGDDAIDQKGVIDGEILAFVMQYRWLCFVDPTGEKLGLLRVALIDEQRLNPSKLNKMAVDYAATLDVLRSTGGEPDKIRAFAGQLGYKEGDGRTSQPLPTGA